MGIPGALPRQISLYAANERWQSVWNNIRSSLFLLLGASICLASLFLIVTPYLATKIYNTPELQLFFIYFGIGVPFYILMRLSASVFRGFEQMRLFVLFRHLFRQAFIFGAILVFVLFSLPASHLGAAYLVAFVLAAILSVKYVRDRLPEVQRSLSFNLSDSKQLFQFSWPLMMSSVIMMLMHYTDTLILGAYLNQEFVGLYNAAVPIAELFAVVYDSFVPLLLPIMTGYLVKKNQEALRTAFILTCKWIYLLTLPFFILVMIYPRLFLGLMFGNQYLGADDVLRVLSCGIFFASIVGPTGNLLIVIGKPRIIFYDTLLAYILNVLLNLALIPELGIIGAALATALSLVCYNILTIFQTYHYLRLAPPLLIYVLVSIAGVLPMAGLLFFQGKGLTLTLVLSTCVLFLLVYVVLNLVMKTIDKDDKMIFDEVKKRLYGRKSG